ncbi:MAG TPA: TIGR04255 family protein [Acidimicrobiales bacterium]|nr:TIGR04255 family protein [Acidimicrobiales bacterium]
MNEHEVYPNAPVVVATVEVRHTETPSLTQPERKKVKQALSQWAPIQRSSKQLVVTGLVGAAGAGDHAFEEFPKYFSRDSMLAISFRKEAVVIEATRYDGWLAFKDIVEAAVGARADIGVPDAVERVGIRYLNEIRPADASSIDWTDWLNSAVLGPIKLGESVGLEAKQWQGQAVYGPENGRSLVLRYAPGEGQAVETGQELVRSKFTPGPFMWIDIDSFWLHEATLPEFDTEVILGRCVDLHTPLRTLFEKLITPKLREVLRRG